MLNKILKFFRVTNSRTTHKTNKDGSLKFKPIIAKIKKQKLTYLSYKKLNSIAETCCDIESKKIPGIYIEAGCALGGSTILIGRVKSKIRRLRVYDVFGMIPPPTAEDPEDVQNRFKIISEGRSRGIGGDKYYGYENDLISIVKNNLKNFKIDSELNSVSLIQGLLQDTLEVEESVAFAHIDVDWYDPVKTCLERIGPFISLGGVIILDDYFDWGGCRKAVDEFLPQVEGEFALDDSAGSLKLTRVKSRLTTYSQSFPR